MLANDLRALRLRLGLTQAELGAKLGVSRTAIAYYEAGKRNMRKPVAMLADNLNSDTNQ